CAARVAPGGRGARGGAGDAVLAAGPHGSGDGCGGVREGARPAPRVASVAAAVGDDGRVLALGTGPGDEEEVPASVAGDGQRVEALTRAEGGEAHGGGAVGGCGEAGGVALR